MMRYKLVLSLLISFILTALISLYFYFSPLLLTPVIITDISVSLSIVICVSALVYACVQVRNARDVALALFAVLLMSFLARAVPHLVVRYPPFSDAYFYAIAALNISDYGTLQPVLSNWYPLVGMQLSWPVLHVLTSALQQISGVDAMWLFRFEAPLLGGIFSLAVFSLAKAVSKNDSVALLAALFASLSDVVIFYQSEYHPQGLAILLFVFLIYAWLKFIEKRGLVFPMLFSIFAIAMLFSHHFSSLYLGLIVLSFVALSELLLIVVKRLRRFHLLEKALSGLRRGYLVLICFGLVLLFSNVILRPVATESFAALAATPTGVTSAGVTSAGVTSAGVTSAGVRIFGIPLLTFLLRLAKWGILFAAIASIIYIIRKPDRKSLTLILLLVSLVFSGILGMALSLGGWMWNVPIDRFIAFYAPLISVFAALTVYKLITVAKPRFGRAWAIKWGTVLVTGMLLAAGFLNAQIPGFYFKSIGTDTFYWYSNDLSSVNRYECTGQWLRDYTPANSKYLVESDTFAVPFFFARRPIENIQGMTGVEDEFEGYVVVNPGIPYNYACRSFDKAAFVDSSDLLYINRAIVIVREGFCSQPNN
jgi:hypothetical protein